MRVGIPSPLMSYTGSSSVDADGADLRALLLDLDRRYPGIRFRMVDEQDRVRRHMRVFVNGAQTFSLDTPLAAEDQVFIVQALSGG